MWNFMTQPGLATTVLDFTDALAWFWVGLFGLWALAAWLIAYRVVRYQVSQRATRAAKTASPSYQEAA